jgi:hypothetical protein
VSSKVHLIPVPDVPNRRHPAYEVAFEAYLVAGGHVSRALALVSEMWDPDLYGAELPTAKSLRVWVREDNWIAIQRDWATKNRKKIRESLNADILLRMKGALDVVTDIMHDTEGDPKTNSVRLGAANRMLTLGAAGVQETRYGDLPEYDIESREAVARVRSMSPEQILEVESAELAAERTGDGP